MTRVALKGLLGRKLRATLTALAIVLGVAMISGTYVLTDTIKAGFDTIFKGSYQNTDAVISGKTVFKAEGGPRTGQSPGFPDSLLAQVQRLPGVAAAAGSIADEAKLIDKHGKAIGTGGAPNLAFSVSDGKEQQRFNPLTLVSGHWPRSGDEIVIDKATADKKGFHVGDEIGVSTRSPVRRFRISGIAELASVASIGGATIAAFDVPTAQRLFGKEGKLDVIRIAAKPGVSPAALVAQVRPLLPATAEVKTAAAQAKSDAADTSGFLDILQDVLLAFGGIALFVGSFVIANTLSITIAQRVREFATLRTLGATRRQVLRSVILEALVLGVLASVAGLFAGLAVAEGLNQLFVALGIDLPKSATVFSTRTIVVSLLVGVLITLLASLRPALRATSIPPIAAVREGSVLPRSRLARFAPAITTAVLVIGVALLAYGVLGSGLDTATRLVSLGVGVLMMFLGVALVAPRLVRPLASVLGWPGSRFGGAPGALARENAMRNPNRTASTASALMIGLALVTVVAVLGQGLRSSFEDSVDQLFHADYALTTSNGFTPLTAEAAKVVARAPGVDVVSSVRAGDGRVFGDTIRVTAVEPNVARVVKLDWYRGSSATPSQLGRDGAFVDKDFAKDKHLHLGSPLRVQTPTGPFLNLRVKGIYEPPTGGSPFAKVTISTAAFDAAYTRPENIFTFIDTSGGASPAHTSALKAALAGFPDAKIATASEFKKDQASSINTLLNALYALLGLSVLISLFGIVNTLVLTVFERTRELGMLRAVGMTRRQLRRMIRYESVITALIGAVLGIVVGLALAALITNALSSEGFAFVVPGGTLVSFVIVAVVAGLIAAILPARRAARLNVLEALHYE